METFDWLPVTSSPHVRGFDGRLKVCLPIDCTRASHRGTRFAQVPPTRGRGLTVPAPHVNFLKTPLIGRRCRHSRCVTRVGWQTSFNIICGGEQGKSTTEKCCLSTAAGRTEWRQRCQPAEITNPSATQR